MWSFIRLDFLWIFLMNLHTYEYAYGGQTFPHHVSQKRGQSGVLKYSMILQRSLLFVEIHFASFQGNKNIIALDSFIYTVWDKIKELNLVRNSLSIKPRCRFSWTRENIYIHITRSLVQLCCSWKFIAIL